jgi:hypothetical protein
MLLMLFGPSDAFQRARLFTRRSGKPCDHANLSFGFAKCSQHEKKCAEKFTRWKSPTIRNFGPFLRLFARCPKHRIPRKSRSDFPQDGVPPEVYQAGKGKSK